MENFGEWDQNKLKNELLKGMELAKQLQIQLDVRSTPSSSMAASSSSSSSSSSSNDGCELLVQKILCSYEKALSLLNSYGAQINIYESPSSFNGGSPRSEDSDREFKDPFDITNANSFRKRNILPTWTQKFQVSPGMAIEGSLDDGFAWRKYGQKGILGAKHPRGYYRCTHRNLQGCQATKQVQRSDDDPTIFEITYRGKHSCSQVSNLSTPCTTTSEFQQQNQVITQNLDTTHEPTLQFHPLCYDRVEFASTSTVDVNFTEFSSFLSPTTSGSGLSYFSASSSGLSEGFVVGNQNLNNLQPNNCEIFSSPTSALNTQTTTALDFSFGELQMEPTFSFDNTDFFS
ncbi:putative WRKY transcription factor 53 [Cucumis melo var. makuwa]|uniref:Putative WRKY transcription factor 53 n=1 Tax=Cucumis melo var. makuwa TaxID=1194695 RepID=A0A5D3BUI3_CUCMM|nr:putative WRKY transcription factor 53 [Cucumis melo var. makuwa]